MACKKEQQKLQVIYGFIMKKIIYESYYICSNPDVMIGEIN